MLQQGLLEEVATLNTFASEQAAQGELVDDTRGIWVSIGHKEFKAYSTALAAGVEDQHRLSKLKMEGLERTKIATRQYSKRQVRWIRIKLLNALAEARSSESLYLLDGTNVDGFEESVVQPAADLTETFLRGESMPEPRSLSSAAAEMLVVERGNEVARDGEKWSKQHCVACDVTCVLPEQWQQHIKSKTHKKLVSKMKAAKAAETELNGQRY
jgi:tRNA dimethylallyltransferase